MKILQILYGGLGGHAAVALSLVRGDVHRRAEHDLVFYGIEPEWPRFRRQCEELGAGFHWVHKRAGLDLRAWGVVLGEIARRAPDVVIFHVESVLPPVLLGRVLTDAAIVVVDHQAHGAKSPAQWRWLEANLRLADAGVLLTEHARQEVLRRFPTLPGPKVPVLIPNGIDLERWSPPRSPREGSVAGPVRAIMASRINPLRDHATLLRAMQRLERDRPGRLRLTIAGDGPSRRELEALSAELEVSHVVDFVGRLDEGALIDVLCESDLYVHASHHETMSTSVMQALACGLPVVGADISGVRELVGDAGALAAPHDVARWASAIAGLRDDADERHTRGEVARARAEARFSHELMFSRYHSVCEQVRLARAAVSG